MSKKNQRILIAIFFSLLFHLGLFFCLIVYAGTVATSSITAQTIIDDAERTLNSGSDSFFAEADYLQWIDEAVKEVVYMTGCLEAAKVTITLVANTYSYALGQAFLQVIGVEHDNEDTTDSQQIISLSRVRVSEFGRNDSTGRPQVFRVWSDKIEVWPIPRTDEADTSLYVYSVTVPTGVSATNSTIETPSYFDTALVYYTVAMAYFKDRQFAKGSQFLSMFYDRIKAYNSLVLRRYPIE